MIVTFCGHAQLSQNSDVEKWLYTVTGKLIEEGAASFYLGGYGAFDSLAASVLKNQKKQHAKLYKGRKQTVKRAADNKRRYAPGEGSIPPVLLSGVSKGVPPLAHDFACKV